MFSTKTFAALLAFAAPLLVLADVGPIAPAPNDTFIEGSNCHVAWTGDTSSTTLWKNMAIELMSGPNDPMVHITTVAQGLDGSKDGVFDYTCPEVTPHSPIYFYQFSAPNASNHAWTGRFTIVSPTGEITAPTNIATDADGTVIHWGIGKLVDPSTAIAAPSFDTSTSNSTSSMSIVLPVVTSSAAGSSTGINTSINTGSAATATDNSSTVPLSTSASPNAQPTSGAMTTFDIRILGAAAAATLVLSFVW